MRIGRGLRLPDASMSGSRYELLGMNCILLFLVAITTAPISNAQCTGSMSSGVYNVLWAVLGGNVNFTVFADTTGWVGVGFSLTSDMVCKTYIYIYIYIYVMYII